MISNEYRIGTHEDVPHLVEQLTRLSNDAFAEYEGAMPVSEEFTDWYLQRPGSRPDRCTAALLGERLVSNVLVAVQDVRLGGQVMRCGIIDTVATDPAHRRKGLARRLMEDAHKRMLAEGCDAAVLYTNPDGMPYRFYQTIGYLPRAVAGALMGPRGAGGPNRVQRLTDHGGDEARSLVDRFYAGYDGYAPLTDELWAWHRVNRPADMPVQTVAVREGSTLKAVGTYAVVPLLLGGAVERVAVLCDFACEAPIEEALNDILGAAPCQQVMAFWDTVSEGYGALRARGYEVAVREASLVLPFTEAARQAAQDCTRPWYCMVESLVGV